MSLSSRVLFLWQLGTRTPYILRWTALSWRAAKTGQGTAFHPGPALGIRRQRLRRAARTRPPGKRLSRSSTLTRHAWQAECPSALQNRNARTFLRLANLTATGRRKFRSTGLWVL